jgi:predicted DNA-binding transcriptional regulator AlpA
MESAEAKNGTALMSVGELAALLGLHVKVTYRHAAAGDFDDIRVKIGDMRLLRFDRTRVLAAIASGQIGYGSAKEKESKLESM